MTESLKPRINARAFRAIDQIAQSSANSFGDLLYEIAEETLIASMGDKMLDLLESGEGDEILNHTENALADLFIQRFRHHL